MQIYYYIGSALCKFTVLYILVGLSVAHIHFHVRSIFFAKSAKQDSSPFPLNTESTDSLPSSIVFVSIADKLQMGVSCTTFLFHFISSHICRE